VRGREKKGKNKKRAGRGAISKVCHRGAGRMRAKGRRKRHWTSIKQYFKHDESSIIGRKGKGKRGGRGEEKGGLFKLGVTGRKAPGREEEKNPCVRTRKAIFKRGERRKVKGNTGITTFVV